MKNTKKDVGGVVLVEWMKMKVSEVMGVPRFLYIFIIIHFRVGFSMEINHLAIISYWGTPMTMETPMYPLVNQHSELEHHHF